MVTAIRTTCKKGKKEWDGNNSSGGGDKREGRKDCLKKIKRGVWGGGGRSYIAVVVLNVGASEYYRFTSKGAQKQCCCLCMQRKYF